MYETSGLHARTSMRGHTDKSHADESQWPRQSGPDAPDIDVSEEALRARFDVLLAGQATVEDESVHCSASELKAFARERRRQGASWDMPGHLMICPLCLEAFDVVLQGAPAVRRAALRRFFRLGPRPGRVLSPAWRTGPLPLQIAAALAILLAGAWGLDRASRGTTLQVEQGRLVSAEGRALTAGAAVPGRAPLRAALPSVLTLADGSRFAVSAETLFSVRENPAGGQTVKVEAGEARFEVEPRKPGRSFIVRTPLGALEVIGTRFTVTSRPEQVTVFEHDGGSGTFRSYRGTTSSVTIAVTEGHVRVWNRHEEAHVRAGQSATLRPETAMIEVTGTARTEPDQAGEEAQ
jgi:hypothetical protein